MPRTMSPDAVRAFLSQGTRTAKVATSGPGGQPHVMPVWFVLDGEELVFTTGGDSIKGRNLRRDPRVAVVVDEEVAPYAFVHIRGHVTLSEDDLAPTLAPQQRARNSNRPSDLQELGGAEGI
jgi:PPOX class probable F420-dependent enzyme